MDPRTAELEMLKLVASEYAALREEIRLLMNAVIRDFQIFLGFLAAMFALSKRGSAGGTTNAEIVNIQVVISFIPFLFFAFSLFFLIKMSNMMTNAAYIRNIEKRINKFFNSNVLNWESSITPKFLFKWNTSFVLSSLSFSLLLFLGYIVSAWLGYFYFLPKNEFISHYLSG